MCVTCTSVYCTQVCVRLELVCVQCEFITSYVNFYATIKTVCKNRVYVR